MTGKKVRKKWRKPIRKIRQMYKSKFLRVAVAPLIAVLVGCGGGNLDNELLLVREQALTVEGRIASSAEVTSEFSGIRKRSAIYPAPRSAKVVLPRMIVPRGTVDEDSGRYKISASREVMSTNTASKTNQHLNWQPAANGAQVAAVSFTSTDAYGVRLGLLVRALPGSARLSVYSQEDPDTIYQISGQEILQRIQTNLNVGDKSDNANTWWSPDVGSNEVTLEIEIPYGTATAAVDIAIPRLSHVFVPLAMPLQSEEELQIKVNESGTCNLDATCYSAYAAQRDSIARMTFIENGVGYACTGSLINDTSSSGTPYFLTAAHCISTQAAASTLQTDWFYRSATCNSQALSASIRKRVGGAELRFTSAGLDTTLLVLRDTPPVGVLFAGWDARDMATTIGTQVVGLHHPRADLLKAAFGQVMSFASCNTTGDVSCRFNSLPSDFLVTNWREGVVESGSSGSPIFTQDGRYILGVLFAGNVVSACYADGTRRSAGPNIYSRFSSAYQAGLWKFLGTTSTTPSLTVRQPIFRFYNASTGAHFFTINTEERDNVIRNMPAYLYEGIAFYAYNPTELGYNPVFRFYNLASGAHFYTISASERSYVQSTLPTYKYEGSVWSAQQTEMSGTSPVYRFYRSGTNTHFYTINRAERDFVIANDRGYAYEGAVYHAWAAK